MSNADENLNHFCGEVHGESRGDAQGESRGNCLCRGDKWIYLWSLDVGGSMGLPLKLHEYLPRLCLQARHESLDTLQTRGALKQTLQTVLKSPAECEKVELYEQKVRSNLVELFQECFDVDFYELLQGKAKDSDAENPFLDIFQFKNKVDVCIAKKHSVWKDLWPLFLVNEPESAFQVRVFLCEDLNASSASIDFLLRPCSINWYFNASAVERCCKDNACVPGELEFQTGLYTFLKYMNPNRKEAFCLIPISSQCPSHDKALNMPCTVGSHEWKRSSTNILCAVCQTAELLSQKTTLAFMPRREAQFSRITEGETAAKNRVVIVPSGVELCESLLMQTFTAFKPQKSEESSSLGAATFGTTFALESAPSSFASSSSVNTKLAKDVKRISPLGNLVCNSTLVICDSKHVAAWTRAAEARAFVVEDLSSAPSVFVEDYMVDASDSSTHRRVFLVSYQSIRKSIREIRTFSIEILNRCFLSRPLRAVAALLNTLDMDEATLNSGLKSTLCSLCGNNFTAVPRVVAASLAFPTDSFDLKDSLESADSVEATAKSKHSLEFVDFFKDTAAKTAAGDGYESIVSPNLQPFPKRFSRVPLSSCAFSNVLLDDFEQFVPGPWRECGDAIQSCGFFSFTQKFCETLCHFAASVTMRLRMQEAWRPYASFKNYCSLRSATLDATALIHFNATVLETCAPDATIYLHSCGVTETEFQVLHIVSSLRRARGSQGLGALTLGISRAADASFEDVWDWVDARMHHEKSKYAPMSASGALLRMIRQFKQRRSPLRQERCIEILRTLIFVEKSCTLCFSDAANVVVTLCGHFLCEECFRASTNLDTLHPFKTSDASVDTASPSDNEMERVSRFQQVVQALEAPPPSLAPRLQNDMFSTTFPCPACAFPLRLKTDFLHLRAFRPIHLVNDKDTNENSSSPLDAALARLGLDAQQRAAICAEFSTGLDAEVDALANDSKPEAKVYSDAKVDKEIDTVEGDMNFIRARKMHALVQKVCDLFERSRIVGILIPGCADIHPCCSSLSKNIGMFLKPQDFCVTASLFEATEAALEHKFVVYVFSQSQMGLVQSMEDEIHAAFVSKSRSTFVLSNSDSIISQSNWHPSAVLETAPRLWAKALILPLPTQGAWQRGPSDENEDRIFLPSDLAVYRARFWMLALSRTFHYWTRFFACLGFARPKETFSWMDNLSVEECCAIPIHAFTSTCAYQCYERPPPHAYFLPTLVTEKKNIAILFQSSSDCTTSCLFNQRWV